MNRYERIYDRKYFKPLQALTLKRQSSQGVNVPVVPDLSQRVKVRSDESEKLTKIFGRVKDGYFR